jgi:DNA-binding HxlR family transcriptional regulator
VVAVLADKWALYVLGALRMHDRPMRFNLAARKEYDIRAAAPPARALPAGG